MPESPAQCCFCGAKIESAGAVSLIIPLEDGGSQQLWAHATCLRASLHESVPLAIFEDDGRQDMNSS
jgi:hypothetical protein